MQEKEAIHLLHGLMDGKSTVDAQIRRCVSGLCVVIFTYIALVEPLPPLFYRRSTPTRYWKVLRTLALSRLSPTLTAC